jgi:hypothetical protein
MDLSTLMHMTGWQYSQPRNITAFIGPDSDHIASGKKEYQLVDQAGKDLHLATDCLLLRNWSVKVNGQEVYGTDCYVDGGYIMGIPQRLGGEWA